jgi:hypothetical protein
LSRTELRFIDTLEGEDDLEDDGLRGAHAEFSCFDAEEECPCPCGLLGDVVE